MQNTSYSQYNVRVPMRDGVTLSADIYMPEATRHGERVPVILVRTPYNKNQLLYIEAARYFSTRGYAYVTLDVHGRGDSDGEFVPYVNDGRDGYDAIEWCAAQSWSIGNVGTLGAWYLGPRAVAGRAGKSAAPENHDCDGDAVRSIRRTSDGDARLAAFVLAVSGERTPAAIDGPDQLGADL